MAKAVYPGSFDPITLGHIDIIKRVSPFFDGLTVLISNAQAKQYMFSAGERKSMVEAELQDLKGVNVELHDGLTVDYLKKHGSRVIIRGIRAVSDFEHELVMANMNRKLAPDIETMVVFASPQYHFVASRIIKEIAAHKGNLEGLVPAGVIEALQRKLRQKTQTVERIN